MFCQTRFYFSYSENRSDVTKPLKQQMNSMKELEQDGPATEMETAENDGCENMEVGRSCKRLGCTLENSVDDMIGCDSFQGWYHYMCTGLTKEQMQPLIDMQDSKYYCNGCKTGDSTAHTSSQTRCDYGVNS